MTRDEAIRILDPVTSMDALAEIEYYAGFRGEEAVIKAVYDACILAVSALREQEERRCIPVTEPPKGDGTAERRMTMKRKIKRLIQKMACFLFTFMYAIGWFMTYAFLAFLIFGDAIVVHESVVLAVSALAGGVSGGLLYMFLLKS